VLDIITFLFLVFEPFAVVSEQRERGRPTTVRCRDGVENRL